MEFAYYVHNFEGKHRIFRVVNNGKIHENSHSIEMYDSGKWIINNRSIKSFMNNYVTGWIDEHDAIFDFEIVQKQLFIKEYITVKDFAINIHKDQKYGKYPYDVHLINVVGVLFRNRVFLSGENYIILASAWLHDAIEDTSVTKQDIVSRFGVEVYNVIDALTDGDGSDRVERKNKMYAKLIASQEAIIVKLADRIANLEFSIINSNIDKVLLYVSENDKLNSVVKSNIKTELGVRLLNQLNNLVESVKQSV